MTVVTPCGAAVNDADCPYCLKAKDCREVRNQICRGCTREYLCPLSFKRKRAEEGECMGRELI